MNKQSFNNNFEGILSTTEPNFFGQFEDCSRFSTIIVNVQVVDGSSDYLLMLQQSNSNLSQKFDPEPISTGQPVVVKMKYFRVAVMNQSENSMKVVLETNLLTSHVPHLGPLAPSEPEWTPIDLQEARYNGQCFSVTMEDHLAKATAEPQFVLFNPQSSGKTIYVYQIYLAMRENNGDNQAPSVDISIKCINGYTGGNPGPSTRNLKFGSGVNSGMETKKLTGVDTISNFGTLQDVMLSINGNTQYLNFKNDFIEIPEGYGIGIRTQANGGSNSVSGYTVNVKYVEQTADPIIAADG